MNIIIRHPHVEEKHIKHAASLSIIMGTVLEAAHIFYPSGLLLLATAGCIAVYEPYIIRHVKGDLEGRLNEEEE